MLTKATTYTRLLPQCWLCAHRSLPHRSQTWKITPFTIGHAHVCVTDIGILLIWPYPGNLEGYRSPILRGWGLMKLPPKLWVFLNILAHASTIESPPISGGQGYSLHFRGLSNLGKLTDFLTFKFFICCKVNIFNMQCSWDNLQVAK